RVRSLTAVVQEIRSADASCANAEQDFTWTRLRVWALFNTNVGTAVEHRRLHRGRWYPARRFTSRALLASRINQPAARWLALGRAARQVSDDVALDANAQNDLGRDADDARGGHAAVLDLVVAHVIQNADRDRLHLVPAQQQREQEIVPHVDEHQ